MTRSTAGRAERAPGTERICAATGTVKPVAEMIRFVVGPDGAVVPDLKRRLPGRGVWVTATREALDGRGRAQGLRARASSGTFAPPPIWSR